jgi:hypothetical protein
MSIQLPTEQSRLSQWLDAPAAFETARGMIGRPPVRPPACLPVLDGCDRRRPRSQQPQSKVGHPMQSQRVFIPGVEPMQRIVDASGRDLSRVPGRQGRTAPNLHQPPRTRLANAVPGGAEKPREGVRDDDGRPDRRARKQRIGKKSPAAALKGGAGERERRPQISPVEPECRDDEPAEQQAQNERTDSARAQRRDPDADRQENDHSDGDHVVSRAPLFRRYAEKLQGVSTDWAGEAIREPSGAKTETAGTAAEMPSSGWWPR